MLVVVALSVNFGIIIDFIVVIVAVIVDIGWGPTSCRRRLSRKLCAHRKQPHRRIIVVVVLVGGAVVWGCCCMRYAVAALCATRATVLKRVCSTSAHASSHSDRLQTARQHTQTHTECRKPNASNTHRLLAHYIIAYMMVTPDPPNCRS